MVADNFSLVQLAPHHQLEVFHSGNQLLDTWLKRNGLQAQQSNTAAVYLLLDSEQVVGFYAIAMGSVAQTESTARVRKGTGGHPIPMAIIARLAVDLNFQGNGYGTALLKDAVLRTLAASQSIACHGILVHAFDDAAADFYRKFGFEQSPFAVRTLMVLLKDVKKTIAAQ